MNFRRILALLQYDFAILRKNKHRLMEMIYFPIVSVIAWGFFVVYAQQFAFQAAIAILVVQIFWQFAYLSQSSVSMTVMEDIWSRTLRELLSTPLTTTEFLLARIIFSLIRSFFALFVLFAVAYFVFNFNFFATLVPLLILATLAALGSMGIAILVVSVILRYGTTLSFLSWSIVTGIMFLAAPFFPLSVLPQPLLAVAYGIPYTGIFEPIKKLAVTNSLTFADYLPAIISNLFYFVISFPIFFYVFEKAREKGRLIRLWE